MTDYLQALDRFAALPQTQQALLVLALMLAFALLMAALPGRRPPRRRRPPMGGPQAWAGRGARA